MDLDAKNQSEQPAPSLGVLIRARRLRCGLSLQELAERVGCARSYLSTIENGKRNPPSRPILARLEEAMGMPPGSLQVPGEVARGLAAGGEPLRREFARLSERDAVLREMADAFRRGGDASRTLESLRAIVGRGDEGGEAPAVVPVPLAREVPLINRVAAGYPREFTDLSYPARVADEYLRVPDLADPDAFAARVCGDSMLPEYAEGDVVIFSPACPVRSGTDCFVRLEPDHTSTFKRVYFDTSEEGEVIRLQPLNPAYPAATHPREAVAGLYAAVSVMKRIGPLRGAEKRTPRPRQADTR